MTVDQDEIHEAYKEALVQIYPRIRADIEISLINSLISALDMKEGESLTRDEIVMWLKAIATRLLPVEA